MASEKTTRKDLLKAEEQQQASAVNRVTSLPLLNSAFNLVSSAYNHTKETHPCLSGVCNVAETVAAVAVGSMVGGAQPILNQLEPQIALVNEYACKRLDQLEENLPFLQQPADKVISDTKQLVSTKVTSAMDAACEAKAGAKDLVTNKVTEAMDLTKGAVQESVEKTKSVVTSTVSTALDAAVSQAVAGGVETVLGMSEDLVDQYLPMTEEELGQLATTVEGFGVASVEEQKQQRSYFVRLGSLSSRVQHRAYQLSLSKLQHVRHSTQASLSRLQLAINLIESVKQEVGQKLLDGQEKLHKLWVDWSLTQPKGNQIKTASYLEVESRTLAMLRIITQQLQPVYENLKTSIHGLPSSIQEAVHQATRNIHKLHRSFSNAVSFQDLSSTTLSRSQDCVAEARRSLDDLFEYVTQNTPLNWLVGPFRAKAKVPQECRKQQKKDVMSDIKLPTLEQAASSKEVAETPKEPKGAERIVREACQPEPSTRGLAHCWHCTGKGAGATGRGWQLSCRGQTGTAAARCDLNLGRAPLRPGRAPLRSAPALPAPAAAGSRRFLVCRQAPAGQAERRARRSPDHAAATCPQAPGRAEPSCGAAPAAGSQDPSFPPFQPRAGGAAGSSTSRERERRAAGAWSGARCRALRGQREARHGRFQSSGLRPERRPRALLSALLSCPLFSPVPHDREIPAGAEPLSSAEPLLVRYVEREQDTTELHKGTNLPSKVHNMLFPSMLLQPIIWTTS
ncbi:perilipin-3-like [Indicator indicator]|uniref:perilipin-3-like n=1 Tax=Indicator indicator TaxID=1002788 RepID=UPI0023DF03B4|nr:perilipin-3-like [Indicator indicator]